MNDIFEDDCVFDYRDCVLDFNKDTHILSKSYTDEISAYRAKKTWVSLLKGCLLDVVDDINLRVTKMEVIQAGNLYTLSCKFHSHTARYTFFRMISNNMNVLVCSLEAAHIPKVTYTHE